MGGVVKAVTGGSSKPAAVQVAEKVTEPAKKATRAETTAAQQQQAAFRARRGSGASLISYDRTLGGQSTLQGEDMK